MSHDKAFGKKLGLDTNVKVRENKLSPKWASTSKQIATDISTGLSKKLCLVGHHFLQPGFL